jgi:methylglutaconyl-CoA hydratase
MIYLSPVCIFLTQMIKLVKENQVAVIKLNRPEKRNALHPDLVKEFIIKAEEIKNDKTLRVLIITGEGKSFCAGADLEYLNKLREFNTVESEKASKILSELFLTVYKFPKPTIAAVNGAAIGGGCGLASVCDFIIADSRNAKFGYSEVKIGFIPAIVSIFLIKRIGEQNARKLFLTAEIITAGQAYNIGLADYLTDDVVKESFSLAEKLLGNSDYSMALTKNMINTISNFNVDEAVDYCIKLNTISRSSDDFKKGLESFLKK